ncbi:MAG TPA: S8 family serine peptidase [Steroidobacteraceae bacterium]|nr:S8 family serine peptidase [Steroidobacteraceae bacterium]
MLRFGRVSWMRLGLCAAVLLAPFSSDAQLESNPVRRAPIALGPEADRLLIGFKPEASGAVIKTTVRRRARAYAVTQAQTRPADVEQLVRRVGLPIARSGQLTPSLHVLYLPRTLYGAEVQNALAMLRADPAVAFAAIDGRRYALQALPNDPLFAGTPSASPPASGQWYLANPATSSIMAGTPPTTFPDLSAVDAVDAWSITGGSTGIVIADVDTGVRFDHPDLLRAGLGGRLLPGYDFVGQDYNPKSPYNGLGTFLQANDGDGWDPDPSDPGDWINSTDQKQSVFPSASCPAADSSWHGTRVVGIFGALSDNGVGITGLTWGPWILPVRALGKCGGYDSNIIAGIEWAAGMPVTDPDTGEAAPPNPYPADIINLSLGGGTDACSSSGNGAAYFSALPQVVSLGALVVIAAGNESGPVELPADCAGVIPGVMAVAGLRNVGTKVGYSSFGSQVSLSAPAGNCIDTGGDCLRSMDTTTNLGVTDPLPGASGNGYTNEVSSNLGTSFATPIVSGIAALMRSVNDNLTPTQLAARLESSATAFPPNTAALPVCPQTDPSSSECACPATGQCGSGMVNAYAAVMAAQNPIAAVRVTAGSSILLDASGSAAACGRTLKSYQWSAGSGVTLVSGGTSAQAVVSGSGSVTLTVTDDQGAKDSANVSVTATGAVSSAPQSAGATACPSALVVSPTPPGIAQSFSPSVVATSNVSTLTLTLTNVNAFALTEAQLTDALPAGLVLSSTMPPSTSCSGAKVSVKIAGRTLTLSNAVIPPRSSCTVSLGLSSMTAGSYSNSIAAHALSTGPAGSNNAASAATLTVSTPPASGGGGAIDALELLAAAALLGATRAARSARAARAARGVRAARGARAARFATMRE